MIDLENKKERDKLIDDYFNKGKECDIKEVYQAIVNSTGDLEYEVDKLKSIIKQVREWANKTVFYFDFEEEITKHAFDLLYTKQGQELLEILNEEEN